MGKRQRSKETESRRKKLKEDLESQILTGIFSNSNDKSDAVLDWENTEQEYEVRPRKTEIRRVEGLPIKTSDGKIKRVVHEVDLVSDDDLEVAQEESKIVDTQAPVDKESDGELDNDSDLSPEERLVKIKEEIAELATKLMENPEENIRCLTRLCKMSRSRNLARSRIAMMALIPVFKSLAPSYYIRPLTELERREKVGKEVASLRQFEQTLVRNYIPFIEMLGELAKVSYLNSQNNSKITIGRIKQGQLAARAACDLCLSSLRHFNVRKELIEIVVRRLNKKPSNADDLEIFLSCVRVLETLLKEDEENGDISFDIVQVLCASMRSKKFRVDESVINIFLSLSLLNDYDPNNNKPQEHKSRARKKDRVHLSKKERKARKERKEIEEEMRKAEHAISREQREKFQARVLKSLLMIYLEILRAGSSTATLEINSQATALMAPVLEGLAKFGRMANLDLLGDFLEVLREIMIDIILDHSLESTDMTEGIFDPAQLRTVLLCIATSFALLTSHSDVGKLSLTIDLTKFITSLYEILADLCLDCDLEFSHKTLRLADPLSPTGIAEKPSVNVSTKSELLLRCLDFIFFRSRNGSLPRSTAFIKRLYIAALQTPEKTSLAILKFIGKLVSRYGSSLKGSWSTEDTMSGEGSYILGIESPNKEVDLERSNGNAAILWETVLLNNHYCPLVRDGARSLLKNSKFSDNRF